MSAFWHLSASDSHCALVNDRGATVSYGELATLADEAVRRLPEAENRQLGFIVFAPTPSMVALYLGILRSAHHVPLLLPPGIHSDLLVKLVRHYEPSWLALPPEQAPPPEYRTTFASADIRLLAQESFSLSCPPPHPELALLLPTSGTTGSQKLVRLSYEAIADNAAAIAEYLALTRHDRAITTLPLSYSFGLSILHSHLAVQASIILTAESVVSRPFWEIAGSLQPTSISGVPSTYEMLRRTKLESRGLSRLRMLTQAGGRLRDDLVVEFNRLCQANDWQFFVMYGQTEAAPRISYVPPNRLAEKIGSIGLAIPGGHLELAPQTGELIYRGRNVMLGYAESRTDLARGDDLRGILHTGDTARQDSEGYFFLTGRLKRFVKLSGARVSLDDIEIALANAFLRQFACAGDDNRLIVSYEMSDRPLAPAEVSGLLRTLFGIFPGQIDVRMLKKMPLMANGKIDYSALQNVRHDASLPEGTHLLDDR